MTRDETDCYFTRTGRDTFRATPLTGGAWSTAEQHISPMVGLLVHEMQRFAGRGRDDLLLARLSVDILGVVPVAEFSVHVDSVRPGRTVELLEGVVVSNDRPAVRARGWLLARQDTARVAGGRPHPLPAPDDLEPAPLTDIWPGGYIASLDVRPVRPPDVGRATTWISTSARLLPDEPVGDLARLMGLVDTANGIGVRQSPREWMFPNVDLTVHLYRQPAGPWLGLDTEVVFGDDGTGLTSSVLHDERGPIGRAAQVLTVRPLS